MGGTVATTEAEHLIVLIDRREQRPWAFPKDVETRPVTLDTGDYTAVGVEDRIRIERKSLSDFCGSIGTHRQRFEREMLRMRKYQGRYLVLEFSPDDLIDRMPQFSKLSSASAMGSLIAWSYRLGVQPVFAGDRRYAAAFCRKLLERALRDRDRPNPQPLPLTIL